MQAPTAARLPAPPARPAGLALAGGTHSLLAFCLGWAAANRRRFYARHRELLLAVACLHVTGVSNMMGGPTRPDGALCIPCHGSPALGTAVLLACMAVAAGR